MLVLTRKPGERILIGDDIVITMISIRKDDEFGPKIRIGLEAPSDVVIRREEVPDLRKEGQAVSADVALDSLEAETRKLRQKIEALGCQTARERERATLDAERAAMLCEGVLSLRVRCDELLERLGQAVARAQKT